jgi:hypothetical protein
MESKSNLTKPIGLELLKVKGSDDASLFQKKHHLLLAKMVGRIHTEWRDRCENCETSNDEDFGYAMAIQLLKKELVLLLSMDGNGFMFRESRKEFDEDWFEAQMSVEEAQANR